MKIERVGHKYTIVPHNSGKYRVVMILSEHDNLNDAINAMLDALDKEGDEIMNREIWNRYS